MSMWYRGIFLAGFLFLGPAGVFSQADSLALRYAATITEADLRRHLTELADDAYEGRELGTPGEKKAAAYIIEQFKSYGVPALKGVHGLMEDGYRQQFPVEVSSMSGIGLEVEGTAYRFLEDYFYFNKDLERDVAVDEVVLLGPAILGGTRMAKGDRVVMIRGEDPTEAGLFQEIGLLGKALEGTGVEVVLLVHDSAAVLMDRYRGALSWERARLAGDEAKGTGKVQVLAITGHVADALFKAARVRKKKALREASTRRVLLRVPVKVSMPDATKRLTGENVLAYIEGSDKKDELVVVTAHYDHLGVKDGEVYNGADDDGSGTVAVMEMAEAFAVAKAEGNGPRRSMLFMTVSGEEKGLLGSGWYVSNPIFPLEQTVAALNIDMIGRVDTVYQDGPPYVYVIGSKRLSRELGEILERQNATYTDLALDYRFDAEDDPNRFYYRSDHYNFAKHGIPVAFFFNGVHEDYHGPYDEVDKIRFDLLHQRALLVFHTAWELANREDRPVMDPPAEQRIR